MSDLAYAEFGDYVRARRRNLGLTQDAVARELDVSQPTVSTWERGESIPGQLGRLPEVLQVPFEELADRLVGVTNEVERAIAKDPTLKRKEQKALLAAYGFMTDRPSVKNASVFVWREPSGSDAA